VDQTVLPQQVVFKLGDTDRFRVVPDQAVDFESDSLGGRGDREIDETRRTVDVLDRVFGAQQLHLLDAERLREQFDEAVFRSGADCRTRVGEFRHPGHPPRSRQGKSKSRTRSWQSDRYSVWCGKSASVELAGRALTVPSGRRHNGKTNKA